MVKICIAGVHSGSLPVFFLPNMLFSNDPRGFLLLAPLGESCPDIELPEIEPLALSVSSESPSMWRRASFKAFGDLGFRKVRDIEAGGCPSKFPGAPSQSLSLGSRPTKPASMSNVSNQISIFLWHDQASETDCSDYFDTLISTFRPQSRALIPSGEVLRVYVLSNHSYFHKAGQHTSASF